METSIVIPGHGSLALDELKKDIIAAKKKGLSRQWAFTPETVEGLINKIEELTTVSSGQGMRLPSRIESPDDQR